MSSTPSIVGQPSWLVFATAPVTVSAAVARAAAGSIARRRIAPPSLTRPHRAAPSGRQRHVPRGPRRGGSRPAPGRPGWGRGGRHRSARHPPSAARSRQQRPESCETEAVCPGPGGTIASALPATRISVAIDSRPRPPGSEVGPMRSNSWLAVDVAKAPLVRARELRFAWERFIAGLDGDREPDADPDDVRAPIADSWRRSLEAGIDPTGRELAPVVADEEETRMRFAEHPLGRSAGLIHECLVAISGESDHLVVVTDANGVLLSVEGSPRLRRGAAESMNFAEGTLWSEPGAGTNAIGTALAADHAVQVFGPEHFNEVVQRWTCSAAPVHDPDTGRVLGVIDLTGDFSSVHPHSLSVATATVQAVEASLRLEMQEHDLRLRARYGDRVASAPESRALVTATGRPLTKVPASWGAAGRLAIPPGGGRVPLPSGEVAIAESVGPGEQAYLVRSAARLATAGRPLARVTLLGRDRAVLEVQGRTTTLRPRLGEILALLCGHPEGLSAGGLCAALHGDEGSPSSVRVEVSRLRKLLGPWIETDRYRLTCDVETDVRRVEGLLRAGQVREAAEAYPGPLLPDSEAPGIVEAREQLDAWLRQAVMTADDADALWAWVNGPTGTEDLVAWKRLLAALEFRDPRRSRCAARVGELRRSLA